MKRIFLLTAIFIVTFACEKEDESPIGNQPERLRVKNDTPYAFENVSIEKWDSQHSYGPLQSGETSEYKSYTYTAGFSGYPYIIVTVDGKDFEFDIDPTEDYQNPIPMKEVDIPPLTCVITINEYADNAFSIHFEE